MRAQGHQPARAVWMAAPAATGAPHQAAAPAKVPRAAPGALRAPGPQEGPAVRTAAPNLAAAALPQAAAALAHPRQAAARRADSGSWGAESTRPSGQSGNVDGSASSQGSPGAASGHAWTDSSANRELTGQYENFRSISGESSILTVQVKPIRSLLDRLVTASREHWVAPGGQCLERVF